MITYDFAHFLNVKRDNGEELHAHCPFHEDRTPSFSANTVKGLWMCHAGCGAGDFHSFLERLRGGNAGRTLENRARLESFDSASDWSGFSKVAEYLYLDSKGRELVRLARWEAPGQKRFVYKDLQNGRSKDLLACPYRYETWRSASAEETIFVVEGEKCVDFLFGQRLLATTFLGGSSGWSAGLKAYFRRRKVVILPDNDPPGKRFGEAVLAGVAAVASDVRLIELPGLAASEDVVDWLSMGGTVAGLKCLISLQNPAGTFEFLRF